MGAHLEAELTRAWVEALDVNLTRTIRAARSPELRKLLVSRLLGPQREPWDDGQCGESRALVYWLNHDLLGPISWLLNKRQSKCTISMDRKEKIHAPWPGATCLSGDGSASENRKGIPDSYWSQIGLLTRSESLKEVLWLAETYAAGRFPVLVLGETGTGKDLIARGIHQLSEFWGHLVPVNCAAARKDLFVGELFGAMKGSYTGAFRDRRGLIEEAEGGSIFFDEVADLEPEAQGFLLRFLDSGEVRRLGETRSRIIQTRVIAATCQDLGSLVSNGGFRADLYARLAALVLRVPPLRDRLGDLNLLVEQFWAMEGGALNLCQAIFTEAVYVYLGQQLWSGNVRQLMHFVERVRLYNKRHGSAATRSHLLNGMFWGAIAEEPTISRADASFGESDVHQHDLPNQPAEAPRTANWDRKLLEDALEAAGGFIPEAGRLLGLSRSHAYRLLGPLRKNMRSGMGSSSNEA